MKVRRTPGPKRNVLLASCSDIMSYARMPKLLAEASMRVTVLAPPTSPALSSSHASERLAVAADAIAVGRRLRAMLSQDPDRFDWVILCDEDLLLEVARHLDEPWAARCFPVPAGTAPRIISRKSSFIAACQKAGIPVPASFVCQRADEAIHASGALGFPLVMKADFGASGSTVWRIDNEAELLDAVPRGAGRPFTLQQLLLGEAGVTEMLCAHGRPTAIVSSSMRGIDPKPFGPASARAFRSNAAAEAMAIDIAALTGFHGLCGFDWIQCDGRAGPLYALEFHPRPTLGFHLARRAGVDFSAAIRTLFEQGSNACRLQPPGKEVMCLLFPKDLTRAVRERDLRGLIRWIPGVTFTDLPWRDPGLMLGLARRIRAAARPRPSARFEPSLLPTLAPQSTAFHDDI